jgi:hypothetical protein
MPGYKNAQERVAESIQYSRRLAIVYSWIYRVTRGLIIVLSACAASSLTRNSGRLPHDLAPVLSLIVSILAGLEAWLKPGAIYRAHNRFNDVYIGLESRLSLLGANDSSSLKDLLSELDKADAQYREAIKE